MSVCVQQSADGTIISENWKQAFECPSKVSTSAVSATRVASTTTTPAIPVATNKSKIVEQNKLQRHSRRQHVKILLMAMFF